MLIGRARSFGMVAVSMLDHIVTTFPVRRHGRLISILMLFMTIVGIPMSVGALPAPASLAQSADSTVQVLIPPWGATGTADRLWQYTNGSWTGRTPPVAGAYWRWIAADPFDPQRWLLLGNSDGTNDFGYGTNGVRMRDGRAAALWITSDGGTTWAPLALPARGSYFAARLNQIEWSTTTPGAWMLAGYVVGSTWNAAGIWRGTTTTVSEFLLMEELQGSRWLELAYAVPGLSTDAVVAEWDSPGSGTAGRLGYQGAGGRDVTPSGSGYFYRSLQIDRLPDLSPAIVGVDQGLAGNGPELWATPDYRTTAPTRRLALDDGTWVTTAQDGVYIGGRTNGVLRVTNPFNAPSSAIVAGSGSRIGFIRADRRTQTAVVALEGTSTPRTLYIRPEPGRVWETVALPASATAIANRLDVIVTQRPVPTATVTPRPTSTPLPAPRAPLPTVSRYLRTIEVRDLRDQGCQAARMGRSGVFVLFFGRPDTIGGRRGTRLLDDDGTFIDTGTIASAAKAWTNGFWECDPRHRLIATVVLSTNNKDEQREGTVTFAHGQAWADMVNDVANYVRQRRRTRSLIIRGGSNIEPGFNEPAPTKRWTDGYATRARARYYNIGACSGCPTATRGSFMGNGWELDDIWYVSWAPSPAVPLPQIYAIDGISAVQWQYVADQAMQLPPAERFDMNFAGAFTQERACIDQTKKPKIPSEKEVDPCPEKDNPPAAGWQQLWSVLNADPDTIQALPWSTDVRWFYVPTRPQR